MFWPFSILLLSLSLFSMGVQAGEFDSEQFWQAEAGKIAVVAKMGTSYFVDESLIVNGNLPAENKVTGQIYRPSILAEMGLLRSKFGDYSIATAFAFKSQIENNGVNEPSGAEDAMLALRGRWLVGKYNYSVHYGLRSFFSFGDRVIDQTGDLNTASGGISLEPYLGMQYLFSRLTVGVEGTFRKRFDRSVSIEDNISLSAESATFIDGDIFSGTLFGEMPFSRYLLGLRLKYTHTKEETLIRSTGSRSTNDQFNNLLVGVYGSWDVTDHLVIVPRLEQTFLLDTQLNGRDINTFSFTTLDIAFRFSI